MSWTWQGRQLTKAVKDKTVTFTYDSEGIRTSKSNGTNTTQYLINGTQILAQKTGSTILSFFYDQQGNRVGMADGSNNFYYYLYNIQGDVVALADASTGKLVATYTYDAWGKCTVTNASGYTIGTQNPFRYRGYYYDTETGLYYLNSRYYDPEVGRLLNADVAFGANQDVVSYNLFAYCSNNVTNYADPTGEVAISIPTFVASYGTGLSGAALIAKLTSYAAMVFPYLVWGIAAVVAVAATAYVAYNIYLHSTKTLSDVKSKRPRPDARVYQLAYVNSKGEIIRLPGKMNYKEAVKALCGSAAVNMLSKSHKNHWGIYTSSQAHAKALAVTFGGRKRPEVHGNRYYAHYHDAGHNFHVWYGGKIKY